MVRSMMSYAHLPSSFWRYAVENAVHILNNVPSKSVSETPFELWRGHKPTLKTRGGLFFDPQENRVFVSTNATFLEEDHMRDHKPRSKLILNEAIDESTRVVDEVGPSSRVDETTTSGQSHPSQSLRMLRRSGRVVSQPNHYLGLTETQVVITDDGVEDPLSYKQAMNDVDKDQWVKAMDLEMESMCFNLVWELVDLPEGIKPRSIRILLSIGTFYDYEIWQMDVKTAFLNGNLEESIFMSQPEGFITQGQEQKVCKLNRSIYGLKHLDLGTLAQFQMKDFREAQYVLGIQIIRDRKNKMLALSQATYICKMLVRYSMQNSKKGLLPFRHGVHLSKEQFPKTPQEVKDIRRIFYASVVGSLMYVMLYTRPDICYAVGIIRYTDSDFQTDKDSRKSTSGSVFTLNGGAVVWRSIKQGCITDSTLEAEYVAACEAAKKAVWLRKFLHDLEVVPNMNLSITLYCDNSGTVANSKEPRSHKREKHIKWKYHLIRKIVQ
ncbi:gag/pol protein [Cucumis melo var. makuwa]|uniref:Gag/pol protein n=1 Tax=Cucumis melo var. makuwa TaxID=1194695 RepID=A0A5D3BX24_CUCMM|nr:gag/pol protein [Cucumis melo var. makuwa]